MTKVSSGFRTASSTKASGFGILASTAACAGATLAVGLAPAPVQAQVVLDQTTGTWSLPVGGSGVNTPTVSGENQIRWGTPATASGQSGLGFKGRGPDLNLPITIGTNFLIGDLRHFNNPINAGTQLTSAKLTIDTLFENTNPLNIDFVYTTSIDETPNSTPCAFPSAPGNPCADKISISTLPDQTFTFGSQTLTMATFFLDGSGNPTTSLISQEGGTTTASLYARLTKPGQAPGDEVPGPLPVLGIAAAFGYSRKLRKRIQAS